MSKKIGMLLDNEFPPDLRVENEMRTLAEAGYDVHLLCYDFSGHKPVFEIFNKGITIHRINVSKQFHNKFNAMALSIPIYFLFWKKRARDFVDQFKIDVIHVHDLRLAQVGCWLKKKFNIPYILDLHENYPAALRFYAFSNSFPGNLLISIKRWNKYEKDQVAKADAIITVIEEMGGRIHSLGVDENKIFVIPNYINVDTFDYQKLEIKIDREDDEILLFYSGGFDHHRGLRTIIHAMNRLKFLNPNIKLHLVGRGKTEKNLKELVNKLDLLNVIFHGWQEERAIPSFIEACDIGIVPHLKNEHTDFTIPHKLFQYLFKQKPVIVSDCNPLKRLVEEMEAGLVFNSGDDRDLSEKILTLVNHQDLRNQMSWKGYNAVITKYNWKTSASELKRLYNTLLNL
jgi:glycosyltransferase involved in cell wall biosynthesis